MSRTFTIGRQPNGRIVETADGLVPSEIFAPLMKFDERTGEFGAWSSVEEIDGHNEICDIELSWPAIVSDAAEQFELSKGRSVGVLRRQHRRDSSIGKITLIERREREGVPGIWIEGVCSDEQAKSDAATGVLTGVSIRGLSKKWPDENLKGVTRYAWVLREEDSFVDRPAVPHALIEVIKSDGGIEMVKALGRQPKQFWNCGIEGCSVQHEKKEEALKCDALPSRIEASEKSADGVDAKKSLYGISNLISLLANLLCIISDAEYEETWEAINTGDTSGLPIATQLKEIAQSVFDALEAMIADERSEIDDDLTTEMAMSFAMRALANSETAKQLIKSLRVPSGNGSRTETAKQEDTMKIEDVQKSLDDQARAHSAKVEELEKSITKTGEELAASNQARVAADAKIAELEKQLGTLGETMTESLKAQAKTLALVTGVKVDDDTDLKSVLDAIRNRPAAPAASQRLVPVSKSADTGAAGEEAKELTSLEKLSPRNRERIA